MSNFEFIAKCQPKLAELAAQAETYVYSDPQSAVMKLRCFAELYVGFIYKELSLNTDGAETFYQKIDNSEFTNVVEDCIVKKIHAIRMKGNKAAHITGVSVGDAIWLSKEAFFLSAWLNITFHKGSISEVPKYKELQPKKTEEEILQHDNKRLQEKLSLQTENLKRSIAELTEIEAHQLESQQIINALNKKVDQAKLLAVKESSQRMVVGFDFEQEETIRRINIYDIFSEYELTDGQEVLVKKLDSFLRNTQENTFLLKGYAGTGKTFITKGLTEYFRAINRNYVLAAPTGKASKVIATKANSKAYTVHKTIYSFKDIKEYKETNLDGSETYKFYAGIRVNELSVDTVYIVDESSMLSDIYNENEFFKCGTGHLLRDFIKFINLDHNDHRKKVIFIGDEAQLPPVGMPFSPALDSKYLTREYGLKTIGYELKDVVRQKSESGVMHNATVMRKSLKDNVFNKLDFDLSFSDVEHVDYADLIERYLETCENKINAESIILAHSNADVSEYNKRIRNEFFPEKDFVCAGDKVMAVTNSDANGFFISNGDFGLVRQVYGDTEQRKIVLKKRTQETQKVEETDMFLEFRDLLVSFRDLDGVTHTFKTKVIENLLYSDAPTLSSDENKALYVDFCIRNRHIKQGSLEFRETLRSDPYFNALRLKFGYAITCHKAQGSEWNHVFVKCNTHQTQLCADYFRWLYTAITRTAKKLYLMDEPHIGLGSAVKRVRNPGITKEKPRKLPSVALEESIPSSKVNLIDRGRDETFGIPSSNAFLLNLLDEVKAKVVNTGVHLHDVKHHNYQEVYIFARGEDITRINVTYKGNRKVSAVMLPTVSELGGELLALISTLKGRVISDSQESNQLANIDFDEPFLEEYYQRVLSEAQKLNININDVEPLQYCQRYHIDRNGESAVIDISYKKTKCISSYNPVNHLSTSSVLSNEFLQVLEKL